MPALIATYTSAAGGSERLLLDVARGLDEPPLIACPTGWLADQARAEGFTVFELPERSLHVRQSARDRAASGARLAAHALDIGRLVRDVRPELVVAWGMRTAIATAAAMRRVPDAPPWIFEHIDYLPGPVIGRAVRAAAARADRIVCITDGVARDLDPDARLRTRTEVIHCAVDPDQFRPDADATPVGADADARVRRGPEVLVLGAIVPWKRPDLALEIAAVAGRELPDLRLRIAGAPLDATGERLLQQMRERAARPDLAGRVEFAGRLPEPAAALREAHALLHCADREPFGLVLVEALASGTPVVAPAAGGPAEIVDNTCGATYPPGDVAAAAAALVDVVKRSAELAAPARQRAEAVFSLPAMQARYAALFRAVADRSAVTNVLAADLLPPGAPARPGAGIAFVTVTFNSARELERLASSIARFMPGARLVVVDNASTDDSRSVAEAAGATLIRFDANRGFGTAANAGVAAVDEPVAILVNPDVELVDDSLADLAGRAQPGRLHAPLLLDPDGTRQDSAHPLPASAATALHSLVPGPALPPPLRRAVEPWQSTEPTRVGWATAACLVAQTETLRQLGPFDESIFLYAEDLDLGLRAETWFHPEARVIHSRAHSTDKAFGGENYELLARQRRDIIRRRLGRGRAIVDDVIELTTFADRALLRRILGRSARTEIERFRARVRAAR